MIKVPSVGVLRYGACVAIVPRRGGREHYILPQVKRVQKLARKGTAGMAISETHKKINLPANQMGYDNSETTVGKLSARRSQICRVDFL